MSSQAVNRHKAARVGPLPQQGSTPREPLALVRAPARSLYVHVPFCQHRCGYCNFAVVVGREDLQARLLQALEQEARWTRTTLPLNSVYIGGGTPSRLAPGLMERLLRLIRTGFKLTPGCEWTVEANPQDVTPQWLKLLRAWGVTRVSLGAQSFQTQKLRRLDRHHSPKDVKLAAQRIQDQGLTLSLDLIFAAPGETLDQWEQDLQQATALEVEHISVYALTIERGTRFWSQVRRGLWREVPEELQAQMYLRTIDLLEQRGWQQYEVSNFARPGFRCRHNLAYWHCENYHAWGPGAARHYHPLRQTNHPSTTTYLKRVLSGRSPVWHSERLSPQLARREALVLALRTRAGVWLEEFRRRWGVEPRELAPKEIDTLVDQGFLEQTSSHLRLTRRGLLVADTICAQILTASDDSCRR